MRVNMRHQNEYRKTAYRHKHNTAHRHQTQQESQQEICTSGGRFGLFNKGIDLGGIVDQPWVERQ
jgi:hypothetical protein